MFPIPTYVTNQLEQSKGWSMTATPRTMYEALHLSCRA